MITFARGFVAAGVTAGLKESGRPDVALVVNRGPRRTAAGVFTTNRIEAAPVTWSRRAVADGTLDAVLLNSGNANAATRGGMAVVEASAEAAGRALGTDPDRIGICSTGVIGVPLDSAKLLAGIDEAASALSAEAGSDAADAIMTTDTVRKEATFAGSFRIGAMAKGAGMIAPGMATMLCVVTTDAVLDSERASAALARAVGLTFNRLDIDGCMSTNDTVLLLASGASGVEPAPEEFEIALTSVCTDLMRQMNSDAEGASHDIEIRVHSSATEEGALAVARAIARSNLFKCAIFGNDPNWGRIISAAGTVPEDVAPFDPADLEVVVNGVCVARGGVDAGGRDDVDLASTREVTVEVGLGSGVESATVWTNDLTFDYVEENSAYTT